MVLIVGAGPTGLSLAAELVRHGITPRIIDRGTDRAHESRAMVLQPRTVEVLARLGLDDVLLDAGRRGSKLRLHASRREVTVPLFDLGLTDTAYPYLLFLSQAETERILVEHLATAGVAVERSVELVTLHQDDDAVTAELRHADGRVERVTQPYVVGCDGGHSAVRTAAGIAFEGGSYPQSFVLADCDADGLEPDAIHAFVGERGFLFFFPLGRPAPWRLLAMRSAADPAATATTVSLAEVQALAAQYTGGVARPRDPVWMTNFRLHHRAAQHYRAGRVFLAGDAAHIHSPAGGQGMNTGIQDSVNLGWKLASVLRGQTSPTILDTYEAERQPVGRMVVRFTDRAFSAATSTGPLVRFARTSLAPTLLPLILRPRQLRAYAFRTVSQLGIRYRDSPLSTNAVDAPANAPVAGDRVPDLVTVENGASTTLQRLLRPAGWHLVIFDDRAGPTFPGVMEHRVTGGGAGLMLVRPDGYIGYRSGPAGLPGLTEYLKRWT